MTDYSVFLLNSVGQSLFEIDNYYKFKLIKGISAVGYFEIEMPNFKIEYTRIADYLQRDMMMVFYRANILEFVGFVRAWELSLEKDGEQTVKVYGPDQNDLLSRRIVYWRSGLPEAQVIDTAAGQAMLDVVDNNFGSGASSTRDMSDKGFTIASYGELGEDISLSFSFQNVLKVIQQIASISRYDGTEIFWNVNVNGLQTNQLAEFVFTVFDAPPGGDLTDSGIVFGVEYGNLQNPKLKWDYQNEINYAIVGGPGEGRERVLTTLHDSGATGASVWNLREVFVDGRQEKTSFGLVAKGQEILNNGRGRLIFSGEIISTPISPYGKWILGSKVLVSFNDMQFKGIVRNVFLSVNENGDEEVYSQVEFEEGL